MNPSFSIYLPLNEYYMAVTGSAVYYLATQSIDYKFYDFTLEEYYDLVIRREVALWW